MENQNDMIMAQNEVLLERLAEALAGGGTSGEPQPTGGDPWPPDPSLSDPDQQ